ncbi:CcdB family protein [Falsiroseomonas sp. E2-1-a20]|uniref:CcdB family protein n=1 Tax=Falsiroseomonas sp. E2-1-a20 TaxID=3239300 RepID=UPI003F3776FD
MAQFDVHRAPGRASGATPFVVVLQSALFDHLRTRLVAPLVDSAAAAAAGYPRRTPRFRVAGQEVTLDVLQTAAIPRAALGPVVGSLADDNDATRIVAAVDEAISRAHG